MLFRSVAGVEDVRVLNGGIQSWMDEGYELTTKETRPVPVNDFGTQIPAHPELVVDIPEAKELLKSKDGDLVSIRSWSEFIGKVSGYNYIEKKGRVPGLFLEIVVPMHITWKITGIWTIQPVNTMK